MSLAVVDSLAMSRLITVKAASRVWPVELSRLWVLNLFGRRWYEYWKLLLIQFFTRASKSEDLAVVPLMWQFITQVTPLSDWVFTNAFKAENGPTCLDFNKEHSVSPASPGFWYSGWPIWTPSLFLCLLLIWGIETEIVLSTKTEVLRILE